MGILRADAGVSAISTRLAGGAWLDEDDPRVMARARRLVRLVDGRIESDAARA